ncbi:hypothetical protein Ccel_3267 [Ruminiclostridium cellulolyticum H10]|uniref:Uncharacterized protein n=1 Tax=Ruminiclostridium cellulolyticum (strain ATCC 35319 / DSM 5812 / JCM 6584 / H10) TaxID=394503 RepID=B8I100_RUMCH|nr:hypothetical protein Ccel_3267 [Ruminiclostridium cellulolyticum H10]
MKYVSTEGATNDDAARRLAGLRTSDGKDGVRFDSDWELQKEIPPTKFRRYFFF